MAAVGRLARHRVPPSPEGEAVPVAAVEAEAPRGSVTAVAVVTS